MPLSDELTVALGALAEKKEEQERLFRKQQEQSELLQKTIAEKDTVIQYKNQIIEQKRSLIREMESTKVWKAYRKYRQLKERKKE